DNLHAVVPVAQCHRAGDVGADQIAGHHVGVSPGAEDPHAFEPVAGDDVNRGGGAAAPVGADDVALRPGVESDAVIIGQGGGSARSGADEIPCHHVVDRPGVKKLDAVTVAGDHVPLGGVGHAVAVGADAVVVGPELDANADVVAQR